MNPTFDLACLSPSIKRLGGWLTAGALAASGSVGAQTLLADLPLFSTATPPSNLFLDLSVEFPTAISKSNNVAYSEATEFGGYFDPNKCYTYNLDPSNPNQGNKNTQLSPNNYFVPVGPAVSHACSGYWSGNFMNWATTPTIDPFRWALSGGNRSIDTTALTVLEKGWNNDTWGLGAGLFQPQVISGALVPRATPFSTKSGVDWSTLYVRVYNFGVGMRVTNAAYANSTYLNNNSDLSPVYRPYVSQADFGNFAVYDMQVRAKVCDPTKGLEPNCTQYASGNFKPTGLIHRYANTLRIGALSYVNDNYFSNSPWASDDNRNGGVIRARMKSVGPTIPNPGALPTPNPHTEWDANTGIFASNPDPADAANSGVAQSGLINYMNQFGRQTHTYKGFDPVGELFYATTRYIKNQPTILQYTTLNANPAIAAIQKDNFPIITSPDDPIQYSCQKNFIVGIGDTAINADGNLPGSKNHPPAVDGNFNPYPRLPIPPEIGADTTVNVDTRTGQVGTMEGIANLPQLIENAGTYFLSGLAYDAHTKDMRPNDFQVNGAKQFITTAQTFWLDVMQYNYYYPKNVFYLGAKYGGFSDCKDNNQCYSAPAGFNPDTAKIGDITQSMWNTTGTKAPDGSYLPDNYFLAGNAQQVKQSLDAVFRKANALTAASSAFAIATPKVQATGNASYSTAYDARSWTGTLEADSLVFDNQGNVTKSVAWQGSDKLETQAAGTGWTKRVIATSNAIGTGLGVAFETTSGGITNATYLSALGADKASQTNMVNYLRGDRSNEGTNGTKIYRARSRLLGDIVDSKAVPVAGPTATYTDATNTGYAAFKAKWAGRPTMVYVGANDGMMHAFKGDLTTGGNEAFAYVPSMLFQGPSSPSTPAVDGLAALADPNYQHKFYVNITPTVVDIDFGKTVGGSGTDWHSVLIGGLGKGGKGYYALDVTDPATITSESVLASRVLWEFTDSRLGFTYGQPSVMKTAKYGWVVILTSGYNNADGVSYFFVLNPKTGKLLEVVSTLTGTTTNPSGLGQASAYVLDYTDFTSDSVYGGDLLGNLFRLDLTPTKSAFTVQRIASLISPSGNGSPITTRPLIETDPNSLKRYVFVGTGKLLDDSDIKNGSIQSFYEVTDGTRTAFDTAVTLPQGVSWPITRANLNALTDLTQGLGANATRPSGWYYDLPVGPGPNNIAERVNQQPTANNGVVAFAGNLPSGDPCNPQGSSQIFAVSYGTGKSALLDANGAITPFQSILTGLVTDLQFVNVNGQIRLESGDTKSNVSNVTGQFDSPPVPKKLNWREVPLAD